MKKPQVKIKEISHQKRRARYTIKLDNGDVFGISEDVLLTSGIASGDTIDQDRIDEVLNLEYKSKIYNSALHLLHYRTRSKYELTSRLLEKDYPLSAVKSVIEQLESMGYVNDRQFVKAFIRDSVNLKQMGPYGIRNALQRYKVSSNFVDQELEAIYHEFPIPSIIQSLLDKKKIQQNKKLDKQTLTRLINFLKRKGYFWEHIEPILIEKGLI
jgi:regulatory protein